MRRRGGSVGEIEPRYVSPDVLECFRKIYFLDVVERFGEVPFFGCCALFGESILIWMLWNVSGKYGQNVAFEVG
jgi:hypothetical protein